MHFTVTIALEDNYKEYNTASAHYKACPIDVYFYMYPPVQYTVD